MTTNAATTTVTSALAFAMLPKSTVAAILLTAALSTATTLAAATLNLILPPAPEADEVPLH